MPKKPTTTPKLPTIEDFGTPAVTRLRQTGAVGAAISKIIAVDEAVARFHHKMVHHGISSRVELALAIASDREAFANFAKDARIGKLPRPPKDASDTLRCLFQATYLDPKKASKYYRRIEPLWVKKASASEVLAFLEKNGVSKPAPSASPSAQKAVSGKTVSGAAKPTGALKASSGESGKRVSAAAAKDTETPSGVFFFWPGKIKVGRHYDLHVKIESDDGETSVFDLMDVTPSRLQ